MHMASGCWVCLCLAISFQTRLLWASKPEDLITQALPGFAQHPFKAYSGFLNVTGPVGGYDRLIIHYQFDQSQRAPAEDPVVVWHTGGPGGSSIYGAYGELGWFGVSTSGQQANPWSWNRVANMLYLESPAGSFLSPLDQHSGFSYCMKNGERVETCSWDDTSQAEAYALTLQQFFANFPEFGNHDLYLVGESYAGQYIPNIAHRILKTGAEVMTSGRASLARQLKGIAVGNGCWGGGQHTVMCNGPNEARDMVALYYGNGLFSAKLHAQIQQACAFPDLPFDSADPFVASDQCSALLDKMDEAVGPHDPFDMFDNCPSEGDAAQMRLWHQYSGKSTRWLNRYLDANRFNPQAGDMLAAMGGGYNWTCGQFSALPSYLARQDVRRALHLPEQSRTSNFAYNTSGPASILLYPEIARQIRVLIYNGQADSRVPHIGNEAWTSGLATRGVLSEAEPWRPWYQSARASVPSGYVTTYAVHGARPRLLSSAGPNATFAYVTFRLAGHEVPHYMPEAAFVMISHWLAGEKLAERRNAPLSVLVV